MAILSLTPNNDKKNGTKLADSINGLAGADTLTGLAGNDTLLGGTGNDYLDGGTDNDLLIGDAGNDILLGGAGNDSLDGGADNDKLDGGAGADTLNGGTGADTLIGGDGNDVYLVDNIGDKITETAKSTSGKDTVRSSIDYTLPLNVENLELTGLANLKATGNTAANLITGNDGDNLLNGGDGFDTLIGGAGDDTLIGGTGVDQLIGGDGSDTYQISSTEDKIVETARDGDQDVVESSVSYTLGDFLEVLTLTGNNSVDGTGNALDNTVEGNAADNELNGMAGDDTLIGNSGDDTLTGGAGDDEIDGGSGNDQVVYLGNRDDYKVFLDTDSQTWVVQDINGTDGDGVDEGTDRLSNIETLLFADTPYIPGQPRLSVADISLTEGNTASQTARFILNLSEPALRPITVNYTTVDNTALANSDYIAKTGSVTFAPGESQQTIPISILGDTLLEANETFLLQLTDVTGADLERTQATAMLLNDDRPSLAISGTRIGESAGSLQLLVTLSAAATAPVSVQYGTVDGTATAGKDYVSTKNTLNFAIGETSKTIPLTLLGDSLTEADETFRVQLSNPTGATLDTAAASAVVTIADDDALSLTLSSDKTSLKAGDTANLRMIFSDIPKNFTASDISLTGGNLSGFQADVSGKIYTALFTPNSAIDNFQASLTVAAGSYTDSQGKPGPASNSLSLTGDTQAPSLNISSDKTSLKTNETANLTFSFSETPSGFDVSDISVNGGSIGLLNGTGLTRTALFTPTANTNNLAASISVNANTYTDATGNNGLASNGLNLTGDTLAPSLSISSDKTSLKANETATVTFSFSEMPMGFDVSDISVSDGSIGLLNGSGLTRTALFIPTANINNLNASISVIPNSYTDTAGNSGIVTNSLSLTGDTLAPSLSISSDKTSLKANETATVTFSFSEIPMGFDASDISVSGGSISGLNGSGLTRTALFIPTANINNLNASISVIPNSYTDTAGNSGIVTNSLSLTGDTLAPSLSISSDKTSLKANETAIVTFSFSELPTGFDVSNVRVNGGTLGNLNGSGLTRTALFIPTANINNLNASIGVNANTYTDATGNNGQSSNNLNLTGDTQAPSLSISSDKTSLKANETATVTFSFSEMPTGFDVSDINLTGGSLGYLSSADGGRTYTAVYTPVANSRQTASISVNANTYTDAVGNSGLASNALNLTLDTQLPSLSITGTTVTEGNSGISYVNLTVSLSSPTSQPVTVNYAMQDGTAQAGSDYLATSNILTIPAGQTTATIQIPILGDTQLEPDETFRVNLSSPPNAQLSNSSATVTIKNDDVARVNNTLTYLGTETIDLDYGSRSGMISGMTFSTGSNESAWIYGDGYGGYGKTARLSIASVEGFSGVDNLTFSTEPKLLNTNEYAIDTADNSNYYLLHILDPMSRSHDDTSNGVTYEAWKWAPASANTTLPSVSISGTMLSEGNGGSNAAYLTLNLSAPSSQTVSVDYSTQNGSAVAVSDYSYTHQTATFAPGQTSQTIQIPIVGDTTVEQDESFRVNLSNPVNVNLGNERSAQVTISNDDVVLPTISISGTTITEGNDGTRNAELTVNLSAASNQTVTVNYATQDGTAQAGSDYQQTSGTLRFEPGDTRETIEVPVIGDTTVEPDESFQMLLSAATHALLNPNATSGTVQISNDDTATAPVTSYSAGQPVIDLGSQYGKLIKPVNVDGHWYYYWDRSGDGTANSSDYTTHDVLDQIFNQDINGTVGGGGNTNDTYRYATLNGVHLALPRQGDGLTGISSGYSANGTAVGGSPASAGSTAINPTYDDLLAVWDAYNGTGTGQGGYGTPPGWYDGYTYWSATPSASGHAFVDLNSGYVLDRNDFYYHYVALEVL